MGTETALAPAIGVQLNPRQLDVVLFALYAYATSNSKTCQMMRACIGAIDALKAAEAGVPEALRFKSTLRQQVETKVDGAE
jgi:hypothetical protein